eukprot:237662-Amphidinium_carterae.1
MAGGARRVATPVLDANALQGVFTRYIGQVERPFDFGVYNSMQVARAVNGSGLLENKTLLAPLLQLVPVAQVTSKLCEAVLSGM